VTSDRLDDPGHRSGDALRDLYASFAQRMMQDENMSLEAMRDLFEQWHIGCAEPVDVTYREVTDAPTPATWCLPDRAGQRGAIVYTHGGGFVVGSRHSHRKLAGHLAARAAMPVLIIDYRRAPEQPHPAQVEDAVATATWLMGLEGRSPSELALAGDSAGGNIAVSAALQLASEGHAPGAVVAMSPWFDMENTGGSLSENAEHDAMVNRPMLEIMTGLVLDGQSPQAPAANPLYADLSSLPPCLVTASSHETLRDDAIRFVDRARAAGANATLRLEPNAQHVFQMAAGRSAAADRSLELIGNWLQTQLAG
jgi:monoterpene epsilon-lactone hydrolase